MSDKITKRTVNGYEIESVQGSPVDLSEVLRIQTQWEEQAAEFAGVTVKPWIEEDWTTPFIINLWAKEQYRDIGARYQRNEINSSEAIDLIIAVGKQADELHGLSSPFDALERLGFDYRELVIESLPSRGETEYPREMNIRREYPD